MEINNNSLRKKCFCCLESKEKLYRMSALFTPEMKLAELYHYVVSIQITEDDAKYNPECQFVCSICTHMLAVAYHVKKKSLESNLQLQEVKKQRILQNIDSQISIIKSMKEESENFDYNSDSTVLFDDSDDGDLGLDESVPLMEALKLKSKKKLKISQEETITQELVEDQGSLKVLANDSSKESSSANKAIQKISRQSEIDKTKEKIKVAGVAGPARRKDPTDSTATTKTNASVPIMEALKSKTKKTSKISLGEMKTQEVGDPRSLESHGSDSSKENLQANFNNRKRSHEGESNGNKKKAKVAGPAHRKDSVNSTSNSDTIESCEVCQKSFQNLNLLEKHLKTVHKLKRSVECKMCHRLFFTSHLRKRHFQKVHKNRYKCGICSEFFENEYLVEKHAELNHPKIRKCHVNLVKVEV